MSGTTTATGGRLRASTRVAAAMLFLGGIILVSGYDLLREWTALQPKLAILSAVWIVAGLVASGCSLWLFSRRRDARPLWLGAAAAIVAGVTLGIGVLLHIVICAGPTCVYSRLIVAAGLIFFGIVAPRTVARSEAG